MNKIDDAAIGLTSAAIGGSGLTLQVVMDGMSFALLALNLVLCIGGLLLVGYRLRKAMRGR